MKTLSETLIADKTISCMHKTPQAQDPTRTRPQRKIYGLRNPYHMALQCFFVFCSLNLKLLSPSPLNHHYIVSVSWSIHSQGMLT